MLDTVRAGRGGDRGTGPVFVSSAADNTSHTLLGLALQQRFDPDAEAVREHQALALAARHGLPIASARLVAELAFSGPGRRA